MESSSIEEVSISDLFDQFIEASTMRNVLSIHHRILNYSDLNPCEFNTFYPKLKRAVLTNRRKNWKAKALFSKIDKKAAHRCYSNNKTPTPVGVRISDSNRSYNSQEGLEDGMSPQANRSHYNNALQNYNCLIIGSGPAGLRTAIELQLLGASRVTVVEKRGRFSRNNVLHLWPFVIDDLKSLGAKKFYGKFCAGSIDHISIRQLQLILLKIGLMVGCDFRDSCSYLHLCPNSIKQTTQVKKVTDSDSKKAFGSCDSTTSITQTCELDLKDENNQEIFTKVSDTTLETTSQNLDCADNQDEKDVSNKSVSQVEKESPQESKADVESSNKQADDVRAMSQTPTEPEGKQRRDENLKGLKAHFQSDYPYQEKELHSCKWDIIIGADGRRNTLSKFFPRKEFRGRLAIAITANFINRQTPVEAAVAEISGLSFIYNQDMFNALAYDTNIQLENICYYKDDTHYFVMTAKKKSLLERGVLINDYASTRDLLSDSNVNRQALFEYAKDAAYWTTGLEPLDFALNHYGQEDCAMFDFTSMYAASNACKALRSKEGGLTLVSLVGDSLLEPFWPTGSGCARGFLSSFDAAWMCRQWAVNKCAVIDYHSSTSSKSGKGRQSNPNDSSRRVEPTTYDRMALSVMAERESIYRILAQTTSENLQQNYSHWTLNPHSRYPNLNRHLVTPSQVEHLIADNDFRDSHSSPNRNKLRVEVERGHRVKSPNNTRSRRSPKKLKSADASPLSKPKYSKGKLSSLNSTYKSRSRNDLSIDSTYLEFEQSYNNLVEDERGAAHYTSHRPPDCEGFDDYFVPSISGTLPSSNNLLSLEARRARDIDECLRQRRQRAQIGFVRDQLRDHFKPKVEENQAKQSTAGNAAIFGELRRLREQQARNGKENAPKEMNGPLTLLNSIRRCASFAERVKSFENKLGSSTGDSTASTPKTPIDDVKNLPQFATLQEIFINNSTLNKDNQQPKKAKMPIMKLTKDDWNVKCWEKRLAAYKQRTNFSGSTKSLNKAISVDTYTSQLAKPEKQVEVFKDRIKEMADKLKKARDHNKKLYGEPEKVITQDETQFNANSKGWVSHIRQELIKGVGSRAQQFSKPAMNPALPNKPIKKLFEDDDEDDGIDVNKHYDHLCINRPTNKYLPKNGYTSHLTRIKYNSATSKVVNRQSPTVESKQAYMAALASRNSSSSSTLSDYSTNTGGSSNGSGKSVPESKCFRCRESVSSTDRINIGDVALHRFCLRCELCGITLRTNEVQHHLTNYKASGTNGEISFLCAICKPSIRAEMDKETAGKLDDLKVTDNGVDLAQTRFKSREDFLNTKINYNELYKNIIDGRGNVDSRTESLEVKSRGADTKEVKGELHPSQDGVADREKDKCLGGSIDQQQRAIISPSPVSVTLPLKLTRSIKKPASEENQDDGYVIAKSESVDGSEQVTLILPTAESCEPNSESDANNKKRNYNPKPRLMIDEDELQRILHLDKPATNGRKSSSKSKETQQSSGTDKSGAEGTAREESSDTSDDNDRDEDGVDDDDDEELSEDSSSLNSAPDIEDYEDDVEGDEDERDGGDDADNDEGETDDVDLNSKYEDIYVSGEFAKIGDREGADVLSGVEATEPRTA